MTTSLTFAVVPRAVVYAVIQNARTAGQADIAREFEDLVAAADADSQDLSLEFIRVYRDHVLAALAAFYVLDDPVGQHTVLQFARDLKFLITEDDLAFVRNAAARGTLAQLYSRVDLSPEAPAEVADAYYYLITHGLAIAEGDLDYFCGGYKPYKALQGYTQLYYMLKQAEVEGIVSLERVQVPEAVKVLLGKAIAASTVPDAFDVLDIE